MRLGAWIRGSKKSPFSYTLEYEDFSNQSSLAETDNSVTDENAWRYEEIRIPVRENLQRFIWDIGKNIDASSNPIDFTGLSLEIFYR